MQEVYNNICVKIINLKRITLWHRIYGSIMFCLSRSARCFRFDLTLIFYAQTSRRLMHRNNDRPTDTLSLQDEHDFYFRFHSNPTDPCVLSQTGNKSRRLRFVLVEIFFLLLLVCCLRNEMKWSSQIFTHSQIIDFITAPRTCFKANVNFTLFSFHYNNSTLSFRLELGCSWFAPFPITCHSYSNASVSMLLSEASFFYILSQPDLLRIPWATRLQTTHKYITVAF